MEALREGGGRLLPGPRIFMSRIKSQTLIVGPVKAAF